MSHKEIKKTNVARMLDQHKIDYELREYPVDPENLSATHIAEQIGENIKQVFKTIVLHGDKTGIFVCVLPGDAEVDLKKAAKISGNKKCATLPLKSLLPTTGYIRGGCSPIGMKKLFPTYIDASAESYDRIYVSAGIRGLQVMLDPHDLATMVNAEFHDLTE